MGERSIAILLKLNGADEARQDLQQLNVAAIELGKAGVQGAGEWTAGFEGLEREVGKVFQRLQQGKTVSESALDPLITRYGVLKQSIEAAFGSADKAPSEFREALTKAEESIKRANEALGLTKDASAAARQQLFGVAEAAKETAKNLEEVAEAQDPITRNFNNIENSFKEFRNAVENGSPEVNEKLSRLFGVQHNLRKEIERTHGAVEQATPEIIERYRRIERQIESAKGEVVQLTTHIQRQRATVNLAGESWAGWDDALVKVSGKWGPMISQMMMASAAAAGTIAAIKQVADEVGVNNEVYEDWYAKLKQVGTGANDLIVELLTLHPAVQLVSTGTVDLEESTTGVIAALHKFGIEAKEGKEGVASLNAGIAAGLNFWERNKVAVRENAEVGQFYERTLRLGREGQRIWEEAVRKSDGTAEGLKKVTHELTEELTRAEAQQRKETEAKKNAEAAARKVADAYQNEVQALRDLSIEHQKVSNEIQNSVEETIRASEVTNGFSTEIAGLLGKIQAMLPEHEKHSVGLKATAAELQNVLDRTSGLTAAEREHIQSMIDATKAVAEAKAGLDSYADAANQAAARVAGLSEAVDNQSKSLGLWESQVTEAEDKIKKLTEAYGADSQITKQAIEEKENFAKTLEHQKKKLEETRAELDKAKEANTNGAIAAEAARMEAERHGSALAALTQNVGNLKAVHTELTSTLERALAPMKSASTSAADLSSSFSGIARSAGEAKKEVLSITDADLKPLVDNAQSLRDMLRAVKEEAKEAKTAIVDLTNAGSDGGGGAAPSGAKK